MTGNWKNLEEMESNLNIFELNMVLEVSHRRRLEDQRFAAALKGIKLGGEDYQEVFDRKKREAQAKVRGTTEEELSLGEIGVGVMDEATLSKMLGEQ
jgi:hypothetical protein